MLKPQDPADFFPHDDSLYIRIQYLPNVDGLKFSIWNEVTKPLVVANNIAILGRGMCEFCILNPADIAEVGVRAIALDAHFSNRATRIDMMMSAQPLNEKPI